MTAMALVSVSFGLIHDTSVAASIFEDAGGPADTFRDVLWHDDGEYAMVAGNDSSGNGVVYEYVASNDTWNQVASVPGDSYNAITRTEPFVWTDDVEGGENGWTTSIWKETQSDGLVGEWKFDEGLGTTANDTSVNNHPGTLINMNNSNWTDGMDGKALEFNGTGEYVDIPNVDGLTSDSFTGMAWINISIHKNYAGIVNKYSSGGWGIWDQTDGGIRFYRNDGSVGNLNDATPISSNEWHHIAWGYDLKSGEAFFYIDGELDYSVASVNPLRTKTPMTIGWYTSSYYLDGQIDEVKIYDQALTPKEISDYYNKTANKVGEWKFNEGVGQYTNDTSQNNYNGTLMPTYPTNVPAWSSNAISGNALYFDGIDDRVETNYIPNTFNIHDHTIEAWVYPTEDVSAGAVIYGVGESATTDKTLEFKIINGIVEVWHWGDNWNTTIKINNNEWSHIVYTYDADIKTGYIYMNGTYFGSHAFTGYLNILNDASLPSQIGMGISGRYFKGNIDEVSIYNYTMPGEIILDNYNDDWNYYLNEQTKMGVWKFDEGTGSLANDGSQYGNDGILTNMEETDWVDGVSGKALIFDGVDEFVNVSDNPGLNMTEFTIEAWINLSTLDKWQGIVSKAIANSVAGIAYHYRISDLNYVQVYVSDGTSTNYAYSSTPLEANTWYHVAVTSSGSEFKFYLDGLPDGQAAQGVIPQTVGAPIRIGSHANEHYFDGAIDEVNIWNRVLSDAEILESYSSMKTPIWQIVDPATIPAAGSGVGHSTAKSPTNVWWFGHNFTGSYDDGERVGGSLISPVKYLPSSSSMGRLVFDHWFDIDNINSSTDIMSVSIKNDTDTGWTPLAIWNSSSAPVSEWTRQVYDISGWLGNYVQVNFSFDSVDNNNNDHAGWHIDDITLYTNDMFIVVGEVPAGTGYSAYSTDVFGTHKNIGGMNSISFNDVAGGKIPATFVAVGDSGQARYWDGNTWNVLTGPGAGDTLTGVDFNGTHFFIVGYDNTGQGISYYITEANLAAGIFTFNVIANAPPNRLNSISWNNNAGSSGYGLVSAEGGMFGLTSMFAWFDLTGDDVAVNYTSAAWSHAGSRAFITANTGTGSAVYDHYGSTKHVSRIPDYDNMLMNHKLFGTDLQPVAPRNAHVLLVGASAFKIIPTTFDQSSQVTVEISKPHIFDIDFYRSSDPATSLVNKQVNVDATYTFRTEVNYSSGGADQLFDGVNNTAIDFIAWYDENGAMETTPPSMDEQNRTRLLNVTWFEGDGGGIPENVIITYPTSSPGVNEFQLIGFSSGPATGDHWWIEVEIYFGQQIRAADGGGFVNGNSSNEDDMLQSFNDANSWNFMINIYDINSTMTSNISYEEFGISRYTNITVSGSPSVNAPPGKSDQLLGGGSQITYSTNTYYFVNVSIPDLNRVDGGPNISASNVNVSIVSSLANNTNSQINSSWGPAGRAFPGANMPLGVWGNASQASMDISAPENGTTAHGPWGSDFNGYGATTVQWYINVPAAIPEGTYRATITFTIGYY